MTWIDVRENSDFPIDGTTQRNSMVWFVLEEHCCQHNEPLKDLVKYIDFWMPLEKKRGRSHHCLGSIDRN